MERRVPGDGGEAAERAVPETGPASAATPAAADVDDPGSALQRAFGPRPAP
ncbi:MAG: hypothetical protein HOW97_19905, partial [Catenulispora sp.]|nr:hypothetical protein [Catenulispora sp.]